MTDQTKCPHCGAEASCCVLGQTYYGCGSFSHSTACVQSMTCELTELRAKVAAQQELLKEAAEGVAKTVQMIQQYDEWRREDFQPLIDVNIKLTNVY